MSDLVWLVIAVIVGMLHLGVAAQMAQKYRTPDWGFGPRDTPMPPQGTAARIDRAYRNFMETFPLFAAALIAVVLQNKSGGLSHLGRAALCRGAHRLYSALCLRREVCAHAGVVHRHGGNHPADRRGVLSSRCVVAGLDPTISGQLQGSIHRLLETRGSSPRVTATSVRRRSPKYPTAPARRRA